MRTIGLAGTRVLLIDPSGAEISDDHGCCSLRAAEAPRADWRVQVWRDGAATQRAAVEDPVFVLSKARLLMREEDLPDEVAAAADAGLVEDVLEVLLDGVPRDDERLCDLGGRFALEHEPCDLWFALGEVTT
jgi:hypothetical protein